MDPIKIGFLLPGLGFVKRGGEQIFFDMGKYLAKNREFEIKFFGGGEKIDIEYIADFIHVPLIKRDAFYGWPKFPPFRSSYCYEEFFYAFNLITALIKYPCDIYITPNFPFTFLALRILRSLLKKKFKLFFHTGNGIWPAKMVREGRLFFSDLILCTNAVYFNELNNKYNCELVPNGFDVKLWMENFKKDSSDRKTKNILCVAALIKEKKVDIVIKAVGRIEDCQLIIVGDGPEYDALVKLAENYAPEKVFFTGHIPHVEILRQYEKADLFINIKEDEPSALVYLEAMASAIPIIADDNPITRWMLGGSGMFIRTNSDSELAEKIREIFSVRDIMERAEKLKARAYQEFSLEKICGRLSEIIRKSKIKC